MLNLYLISQDVNEDYDTYDSAIVCAYTGEEAKMIHPSAYQEDWDGSDDDGWCESKDVKVKLVGVAYAGIKKGIVLASYNAG